MAERLPAPPPRLRDFAPRDGEVFVLHTNAPVWRLYRSLPHDTTWSTFRRAGPSFDARFDHHSDRRASRRSILYAADHLVTCLAEAFQQTRFIDPFTDAPRLAEIAFVSDLRLLDLTGPWITRAGGNMAINSGPRATARRWSRAIYDAFPDIDGLRYGSSMHANQSCYALYDRAEPALDSTPLFDERLSHPELEILLDEAAQILGYKLS